MLTRIQLPRSGSARSARYRRDVAARLVALAGQAAEVAEAPGGRSQGGAGGRHARGRGGGAPVPRVPRTCQARALGRAGLEAQARRWRGVERRIRTRTETLARQFDRVLGVLDDLGYVRDWALTDKGRRLTRIYGEGDLLVGEAIDAGLLEALTPGRGRRAREHGRLRGAGAAPADGSDADGRHGRRVRAAPAALAAGPAGRGRAPGAALPRARARVRRARLPLGRGQAARGRPGRDRDGAGRLRAQLQAARSTCCGRSRRSRRRPPPPRSEGRRDAVARGVVAYTGVSLR